MRILSFLLITVICSMGFSVASNAGSNSFIWGQKFHPYLGDQKISQRSLWDGDTWTPQDWIKNKDDEKRIMHNLYVSDIITKQYKDRKNIPVLEVGDNFISLSGMDRRRVLQFVDHVFEITSSEENGMFYIFYNKNKKDPLGLYNKHGFQSY